MKNESNYIIKEEGTDGRQRVRSKKHEKAETKKHVDSKKMQKVDFRGNLNDSKIHPSSTGHVKSPESTYKKAIDDCYNQSGPLSSLSKVIDCIPESLQTEFTSFQEEKFSALGSMTHSDLGKHVYTLRTEYIQRLARPLIQKLMVHPTNKNVFNAPVDPIAQGVPTYFDRIKTPMDLGTVKGRLHKGYYKSIEDCFNDIELVFQNAIDFNSSEHMVHKMAVELLTEFKTEVTSLKDRCARETEKKSNHTCTLCCGALCLVCGEKCLKFEPPVLVCSGPCNQKVKKNTSFYIARDGGILWCQKCYNSLPPIVVSEYASPTSETGFAPLYKKQLLKRKSDEEVAEPWVECDDCGYWVHQICALYNDLQQSAPSSPTAVDSASTLSDAGIAANSTCGLGNRFVCPLCRLERCAKQGQTDEATAAKGPKAKKQKKAGRPPLKRAADSTQTQTQTASTAALPARPSVPSKQPASLSSAVSTTSTTSTAANGGDTSSIANANSNNKKDRRGTRLAFHLPASSSFDSSSQKSHGLGGSIEVVVRTNLQREVSDLSFDGSSGHDNGSDGLIATDTGEGGGFDHSSVTMEVDDEDGVRSVVEVSSTSSIDTRGVSTAAGANSCGAGGGGVSLADLQALQERINSQQHQGVRSSVQTVIDLRSDASASSVVIDTQSSQATHEVITIHSGSSCSSSSGAVQNEATSKTETSVDASDDAIGDADIDIDIDSCEEGGMCSEDEAEEQLQYLHTQNVLLYAQSPTETPFSPVRAPQQQQVHSRPQRMLSLVHSSPSTIRASPLPLVSVPNDDHDKMSELGSNTHDGDSNTSDLSSDDNDEDGHNADKGLSFSEAKDRLARLFKSRDSVSENSDFSRYRVVSVDGPGEQEHRRQKQQQQQQQQHKLRDEPQSPVPVISPDYDCVVSVSTSSGHSPLPVDRVMGLKPEASEHSEPMDTKNDASKTLPVNKVVEEIFTAAVRANTPAFGFETAVSGGGADSTASSVCGVTDTASHHSGGGSYGVNDYHSDSEFTNTTHDEHSHVPRSAYVPPAPVVNDVHWKWRASSLPRTQLGDFIELMVRELLANSGYADAASTVTVRMTSNCDHRMEVPRVVIENMTTASGNKIPDAMGYRQKCILLFQAIDGVDVCLFCLYVQEYDAHCPAPNTSTVYIAYLDSVDYFRPMEARSIVYHEIIVAYLKWSQSRGFKAAHIWSCPPQRGDNFIFWGRPQYQRTPSRDRLNSWYNEILLRCSKLGFLSSINSLYDIHFNKYNVVKKEETNHRAAAKNSFIGTGQHQPRPHGNSGGNIANLHKNKRKNNSVTPASAVAPVIENAVVAPVSSSAVDGSSPDIVTTEVVTAVNASTDVASAVSEPTTSESSIQVDQGQVQPVSESTAVECSSAMVVVTNESVTVEPLTTAASVASVSSLIVEDAVRPASTSTEADAFTSNNSDTLPPLAIMDPKSIAPTTPVATLAVVAVVAPAVKQEPLTAESIPICSPVFEGDFWLLEYARISKQMASKPNKHHNQHTSPALLNSNSSDGASAPLRALLHDKQSNQRKCREILKHISGKSVAGVFSQPVDPIALNIPTYLTIVKTPMDLSTVKEKLRSGQYATVLDFAQDMRLIFHNAMLFNPPGHYIHGYALTLLKDFQKCMVELVNTEQNSAHAVTLPPATNTAAVPVSTPGADVSEKDKERRNSTRSGDGVAVDDTSATDVYLATYLLVQPPGSTTLVDGIAGNTSTTPRSKASAAVLDVTASSTTGATAATPPAKPHSSAVTTPTPTIATTPITIDAPSPLPTLGVAGGPFDGNIPSGSALALTLSGTDSACLSGRIAMQVDQSANGVTRSPFNLRVDVGDDHNNSSNTVLKRQSSIGGHSLLTPQSCASSACTPSSSAFNFPFDFSIGDNGRQNSTNSFNNNNNGDDSSSQNQDNDCDSVSTMNTHYTNNSSGLPLNPRKRTLSRTYSEDTTNSFFQSGDFSRTSSFDSNSVYSGMTNASQGGGYFYPREVRRRDSLDSICSASYVDNGTLATPREYGGGYSRPFGYLHPMNGMASSASYVNMQQAQMQQQAENRGQSGSFTDSFDGGVNSNTSSVPFIDTASITQRGSNVSQSGNSSSVTPGTYFDARLFNQSVETRAFDGAPAVGFKTAMGIVHELSKCVQRLKDDLFVIHFAPPNTVPSPIKAAAAPPVVVKDESGFQVPAGTTQAQPAKKKQRGRAAVFIKKAGPKFKPPESIPASCLALLHGLKTDTTDPDALIYAPFLNSRHTLLEMCQYRHYQFDSLRRAKHSSMMLIYHLQNPFDKSTRISCSSCGQIVHNIRWHCDQCANYDICNACATAAQSHTRDRADSTITINSHSNTNSSTAAVTVLDVGSQPLRNIVTNDVMNGGLTTVECRHIEEHAHPLTPYRVGFM